jgi:hypothetical protein
MPSRHPSLPLRVLALASLLSLAGCSCEGKYGEFLSEGEGPTNTLPLWPLTPSTLHTVSIPSSLVGRADHWQRPLVISQRATDEGTLFALDLPLTFAQPWSELPAWRFARQTFELLQLPSGGLVAVEPDGRRYLIVPGKVRVGMRWRVNQPSLAGWTNLDQCHPDSAKQQRHGTGGWTFEVLSRDEITGPGGPRVAWRIGALGPQAPHVDDDGEADEGACSTLAGRSVTTPVKASEVPRRALNFVFYEGVGPPAFMELDQAAPGAPATATRPAEVFRPAGAPRPPPGRLPLPADVTELAGRATDALPPIERTELGLAPGWSTPVPGKGLFIPRTARLTWSTTELAAGHAAELLLSGVTLGFSGELDPNGNIQGDLVLAREPLCFAFDPRTGRHAPLDQLVLPCPDRHDPSSTSSQYYKAQPWVRADGLWWTRADIERLPWRSDGTANYVVGLHTQAPFERSGVLHTLNCHGDQSEDPCELVAFPGEPPVEHLYKTSSSGVIQGLVVWSHVGPGAVPRRAEGDESGITSGSPRPTLRYAISHPQGFIHVAVAAWPAGLNVPSYSPGLPEDGAQRSLIIRWFSLDGRLLDFRALPVWQPGLTHWNGQYRLVDARPLGELLEYDIGPEGVRVLTRGRVRLEDGERTEHALALDDERFLVVTSRPRGDGQKRGLDLAKTLSWVEQKASMFGGAPALPDSITRDLSFSVTAPVTAPPQEDLVTVGNSLPLWVTGRTLTLCDAPDAATPLVAERLRLGALELALTTRPRDARGCHQAAVPPELLDAVLGDQETGLLPLAYALRGLGVFRRSVRVARVQQGAAPQTIPPLPTPLDGAPRSVREPATNLFWSSLVAGSATNPGPLIPYALTTCGYPRWGEASYWTADGGVQRCDPATERCLDLLAFDGPAGLPDTHEWLVSDPERPLVPGRADLFPSGRIYWAPRSRPPGPLVAQDFERATPVGATKRHWVVTPDAQAWRLPGAADAGPGSWPASLGTLLFQEQAFDPSALLAGSGLSALPSPVQTWRGARGELNLYGAPLSRWVLQTVEATAHGHALRWRHGPLPSPDARALSTDGTLLLWSDGSLLELAGGACLSQAETCNGLDDDCDGAIDETGADGCPDSSAAGKTCTEGACFRAGCAPGWASCGGSDRCDVQLGTDTNCLACGDACFTLGGGRCTSTGCSSAAASTFALTSRFRYVRYPNGALYRSPQGADWATTSTLVGTFADVVTGPDHVCTLDAAGALECTCEGSGWQVCQGALGASSGPAGVERAWAGPNNTCVRVAGSGAVTCWGSTLSDGTTAGAPTTLPQLAGAEQVVFSQLDGTWRGYALVSGSVLRFNRANTGVVDVTPIAGISGVTALLGANSYVLFKTAAGYFGLGALHRYPALGGPSSGPWSMPTRTPGLDDASAVLTGFLAAPCKLMPNLIRCVFEPGNPPDRTRYTFDAPATVDSTGGLLDITVSFSAAQGLQSTLCVTRPDSASSVVCKP